MALGSESLAIIQAALRWAQADAQRKAVRNRIRKLVVAELQEGELSDLDRALLDDLRVLLRRCSAQVGGYRRGLVKACEPARIKRIGLPHVRSLLDMTNDLDEVRELLLHADEPL